MHIVYIAYPHDDGSDDDEDYFYDISMLIKIIEMMVKMFAVENYLLFVAFTNSTVCLGV